MQCHYCKRIGHFKTLCQTRKRENGATLNIKTTSDKVPIYEDIQRRVQALKNQFSRLKGTNTTADHNERARIEELEAKPH